jgi:hypothetical protein
MTGDVMQECQCRVPSAECRVRNDEIRMTKEMPNTAGVKLAASGLVIGRSSWVRHSAFVIS